MIALVLVLIAMVLVTVIAGGAAFRRLPDNDELTPVDWDRFMDELGRWAAARRDGARPDERGQPPARGTSRRDDPRPPAC